MARSYQLLMQDGPNPGRTYPLIGDEVLIGRSPLSDIVADDPEVSRHHARLTRTAEGFTIQDSGSTNGTFVDGRRLRGEPVLVASGQTIRMGSNVLFVMQALEDGVLVTDVDPSAAAAEPETDFDPLAEPVDERVDKRAGEAERVAAERLVGPAPAPEARLGDYSPRPRRVPPRQEAGRRVPPPAAPLPDPAAAGRDPDRRRMLMIVAVLAVLALLLCCCLTVLVVLYFMPAGAISGVTGALLVWPVWPG